MKDYKEISGIGRGVECVKWTWEERKRIKKENKEDGKRDWRQSKRIIIDTDRWSY